MCRCETSTGGDESTCKQRSCVVVNEREHMCCSNVIREEEEEEEEDESGAHYWHDCVDTLKSDHVCSKGETIINEVNCSQRNSVETRNGDLETSNSHNISNAKNNFFVSFLAYIFIYFSMLKTLQLVHTHAGTFRDILLYISPGQDADICESNNDNSHDEGSGRHYKHIMNSRSLKRQNSKERIHETSHLIKGFMKPKFYYFKGNSKHEKNTIISYRKDDFPHLKLLTGEQTYKTLKSLIFELQESHIAASHPIVCPVFTSLTSYLTRVQNEGSVPLDEEMCYEVRRLQSYSTVPVRTSPMRLAQSGFYATGSGDETRCYSCRMAHSGWKLMDQPDQIHRSVSPECQHLNRRDQRNVPMASDNEIATSVCSVMESYPVTTVSSEPFPSGASASAPLTRTPAVTTTTPIATTTSPMTTTTTTAASTTSGSSDLPGLDISKAVYPQYRDLSRRLDSYQGWGCSHVQDHQVLAKAGFYYAGYRDCVRCFYCGVGLRTWEREDDPWVEHVRWRSSCDYVRLMRGEQFVIQALANGLSVAMASSQQSECSQLQSSQQSMSGYGTGAVSKAEEMGFQRDHIERAVVELTGTHSTTRDNIPLETLLEKLVIMSEQPVTTTPTTYSSIPAVHSSSSAFSTPQSQPISVTVTTLYGSKGSSPEGSRKEMTSSSRNSHTGTAVNVTSSVNMAESQTGAPFTVTSTEQLAPNNSISSGLSSVTNQKAVESSHTKGGSREPAVLSASQERQLEEENQSLRDEGTCKICLDNPSCIVFLPCGHLVTCAECAPALRKCPICRALIRGSVRAHTVSSEDVNI